MEKILIRNATESDIEKISIYIERYKLDGENLEADQFLVAEIDNNLVGFGRIKPYENLFELSSIGVIKEYRSKGIGEKLIKSLIEQFPTDEIWITTKIPDYFKKFGFEISTDAPDEIKQKLKRVCSKVCEPKDDSFFMILRK